MRRCGSSFGGAAGKRQQKPAGTTTSSGRRGHPCVDIHLVVWSAAEIKRSSRQFLFGCPGRHGQAISAPERGSHSLFEFLQQDASMYIHTCIHAADTYYVDDSAQHGPIACCQPLPGSITTPSQPPRIARRAPNFAHHCSKRIQTPVFCILQPRLWRPDVLGQISKASGTRRYARHHEMRVSLHARRQNTKTDMGARLEGGVGLFPSAVWSFVRCIFGHIGRLGTQCNPD